MDDKTAALPDGLPVNRNEDDVQGNLYEFYLLLQKLKAGGMSFDTFLEQALEWATMRGRNAR